jgi:TM2 domain-containing membrane protein YozV
MVALLLSIFLGELGIDRFYLGYIGLGILKLITVGGFGIWWLIDVIMIAIGKMKTKSGEELAA